MTEITYRHTPEMGEISGFGGTYEEGCQVMLEAGVQWTKANPNADLRFSGFKNVFGLIKPETDESRSLEQHIVNAVVEKMGEKHHPTGAMVQAVIQNVLYIAGHSWFAYRKLMEEREAERKRKAE